MSLGTSWVDLAEDSPVSEESLPHASGEPNFSSILNPSPSPAGPPPALACVAGPQEEDKPNNEPLAGLAMYYLRVYTPYTSNNMFDGVTVEAAPPVLGLEGPAFAPASVACPASAGGSAPPTVS